MIADSLVRPQGRTIADSLFLCYIELNGCQRKKIVRGKQYQTRPRKRCWCGSGKKEKNCHGVARPVAPFPAKPENIAATLMQFTSAPFGLPGEEQRIIVQPIFKDAPLDLSPVNLSGQRGQYRVQFLLARPGYAIAKEREYKFIDDLVGTSYLKIAKPEAERGPYDVEKVVVQVLGKNYRIVGSPDKDGLLGKLTVELEAANANDAEREAYGALAPSLSLWSMNADIPIHIETIQVTDLRTFVSSLRVVAPQFEMNFAAGPAQYREEFCQYASIYREGLNTSSVFYRFLCFYKIIESLIAKRGRETRAKKSAGQDPRRLYEVIPEKNEDLLALLKRLYPWRLGWNQLYVDQIFPKEVLGEKVTVIRDKHFRPLRLGIAHALLDTGEITVILDNMDHIQEVNKWLPLCRICARWMLLNDFPAECSSGMR
jgi:hypothetical protein